MQRLRREAAAVGVIAVLLALVCGLCAVFGDILGVGPLP